MSDRGLPSPDRRDLTLATLCVALSLGALYSSPVYRAAAAGELGWSMSTSVGAFAVGYLAAVPIVIFAGRVPDRVGPRRVLGAGLTSIALGLVAAAWTGPLWQWYLGAGIALTSATTPSTPERPSWPRARPSAAS